MPTEEEFKAAYLALPPMAEDKAFIVRLVLEAAERVRENERIRNCKHINKHGSGMIGGSDPHMNWSCDDCGKVWREPQIVLDHHHDWTHPLIREDRPE